MVAIVSGNALGLSLGSLGTLGQGGSSGSATTGRNGELAYVNAATGNLVLQDRDELLVGRGLSVDSLRTYNSRGLLSDDNGDNWSLGIYAQQLRLEGTYGESTSYFVRTGRDGAQARYNFDSTLQCYVSTEGDGAHDTIRRGADDRWVWTDGSTHREEHHNWISGRLETVTEPNGATLQYTYDGARLVQVSTSSGETTHYDYDGDLLVQVRAVIAGPGGTQTVTRVTYGYDVQRRLELVKVDLTPDNAGDAETYWTRYGYDVDSKRVALVTQKDGTSVAIGYDSTGRVRTITDAQNNQTTFDYLAGGRTEVTGPMGLRTWFDYDPSGRLLGVTSLAGTQVLESSQFAYNAAGDVTRVTDGVGRSVTFEYDAQGNQKLQRDSAGNTVTRTFNTRNQVETETRYGGVDTDGAGPSLPTNPLITRNVYDAAGKNRLRFVLAPDGGVTEYIYDALGQRTAVLVYSVASYTTYNLPATAVPTEAQMEAWANGERAARRPMRTDMVYDARGQLSTTTVYNSVSAVGEGVADGLQLVTRYVFDQQGLLRQTIAPGNRVTSYAYDGLGRLVSSTDAASVTTVTIHDDAHNQTQIRYDNGLRTISTFDTVGRLVSVQQTDAIELGLGTTVYQRDSAGRVRMTEDPTGRRQWMLYDNAGRKTADIDGDGSLTEYVYDNSGRITKTVAYSTRISTGVLANLGTTLAQVRPASVPATDLVAWTYYDTAGRVSRVVDGSGAVTDTTYNGMSQVKSITQYATRLQTPVPPTAGGPPASTINDRKQQFEYDGGRLLGGTDGEGYWTYYKYDAAGRRTTTMRIGDANTASVTTTTLYDGQGRVAGEIDGENFLTEYVYDDEGHLARQVRYHPALTVSVPAGASVASIRPQPGPGKEQQVTSWAYDRLNRIERMTTPDGTVTTYTYDRMGRLETTRRAAGTSEVRAVNARYDLQGRLTGELSGEGSALLTGHQTAAEIDQIWRQHGLTHEYDKAGRRTVTIDRRINPTGERTLYFYDADGRLERTVNPLGEVEQWRYNGLNQLEANERSGPGTGDVARTTYRYDNQGLLDSRTVALTATTSATTSFDYDAFGGETLRITDLGGGRQRTDRTEYDRRGLQKAVTLDAGGPLMIRTTTQYDAFGRARVFVDGNGQSHVQSFDKLGRVVQTVDGNGKSRSTTYDAFDRVLTQIDALNQTTRYAYDTAARSVVMTTPEGITVRTAQNRHGQTASITDGNQQTTSFEYDHDGHLTRTFTPLTSERQEFDRAGRLFKTFDANNVEVSYEYDAANRLLLRRVDPSNLDIRTSYQYDGLGRQYRVTDPNGTVTLVGFDLAGRVLTQTVDPGGLNLQTVYTRDAAGNALTVDGPGDRFTRYEYDALGRLKEEHVFVAAGQPNLVTRYDHDRNGNVVGRVDANGHRTQFAYDGEDRLLFSVDALGNTVRHQYDNEGRLVRTTRYARPISLAGLTVPPTAAALLTRALAIALPGQDAVDARRYDKDGRLVFQVDGTGAVMKFKHDGNGNVIERIAYARAITLATWDGSFDPPVVRDLTRDQTQRTSYDALNRATHVADALGTVTERLYDGNGNVLKTTVHATQITASEQPNQVANGAADRIEVFEYDKANRLTWQADAEGSVTQREYDDAGNLTRTKRFANPVGRAAQPSTVVGSADLDRSTDYTYDKAGRRTFAVDALNFVDAWEYADDGTLLSQTRFHHALNAGERPDQVQRDALLDRTQRYVHDAAGRMTRHTDAAGGIERFEYDGLGNKRSFTDKNGNEWRYDYDAAGRLSRQYSPPVDVASTVGDDGSLLTRGSTQNAVRIITFLEYDGLGQLVARTEAEGRLGEARTTRFEYDAAGRQVKVKYPRVGVYDITRDTPATGPQVTRIDLATDLQSSTVYDPLGNAVASVDAAGKVSFKVHDLNGAVTGEIDALGYATRHFRNAFGEVTSTVRYAVATSLADAPVTRSGDAAGVLAAHAGNAVDHAKDRELQMKYDDVGRMVEVKEPWAYHHDARTGTSMQSKLTTRLYDAFGELRVTRESGEVGSSAVETHLYYDALGRRTASVDAMGYLTEFGYDAAGNLVSTGEYATALASGAWDWDGYAEAAVDEDHDRHTSWAYDGMNRKRSETRHHVLYGVDERGDVTTIYGYDAVGNQTSTIDALGATTRTYYDAMGRVSAVSGPPRALANGTTASPLTLYLRDARGNVVTQIDAALGGTTPASYVASGLDRVTLSRFDVMDHEVQRTDAERINHFMSYNAQGLLGKSWQRVSNSQDTDQPVLTMYKGFAYDSLGRVAHAYDPPPFTDDQRAGVGVIDTIHAYNAFGELTTRYVWNTPEDQREYFEYDGAGRLWRSNTGDGVNRIHLYDVLGRETALIVSNGDTRLRDLEQFDALGAEGVRITKTEYDALGRAVVQTLPAREVKQDGVEVQHEMTTQAIERSEYRGSIQMGDSHVEERWEGENEVRFRWKSLQPLGAGEVKVEVEYMSIPVVLVPGDPPVMSDPVQFSVTRIFAAEEAVSGVNLVWKSQTGVSEVKRLKLYKQDAKGEWKPLTDQTTFGDSGNTVTVALPSDPNATVLVEIRNPGNTGWTRVEGYNFGSVVWFNARDVAPGSFEYQVTTISADPAHTQTLITAGTLTLAPSSPPLAALPAPTINHPENPSLEWRTPNGVENFTQVVNYRRIGTGNWSALEVHSSSDGRLHNVDLGQLPGADYEYELLWLDAESVPFAHATGTFSVIDARRDLGYTTYPKVQSVQLVNGHLVWQRASENAGNGEFEFSGLELQEIAIGQDLHFRVPLNLNLSQPGRYEFKMSEYVNDWGLMTHIVSVTTGAGVITVRGDGSPPTLTFASPQTVQGISLGVDGFVSWPTNTDPALTPVFEVSGDEPVWAALDVVHRNGRDHANFMGWFSAHPAAQYGPNFRIRYVNTSGATVALGSGGITYRQTGTFENYSTVSTTSDHTHSMSMGTTPVNILRDDASLERYEGLQAPRLVQDFDRWGNLLNTNDPRSTQWKTTFEWNQNNQLVKQTRPAADGGSAGRPVTDIYYDKLGRQVGVKDANGHINGMTYDAAGQVAVEFHADGGYVTHGYDIFGRRVQTTDAQGNFEADQLQIQSATLAASNPLRSALLFAQSIETRTAHTRKFGYDKLDRLLTVNHGKAYVYQVADANVRGTVGVLRDVIETYTYDEAGRQLTHLNGNGELTQYRYDLNGHIVRTEQRGTLHTTPGLVTRYAFDERGHKTLEIDANGNDMRWTNDAFGRVLDHVDLEGREGASLYDEAKQLIIDHKGNWYRYDAAGQLLSIRQNVYWTDVETFRLTEYTYDLAGNRVRERTTQNHIVAQDNYIGYDALGRMRYVYDGRAHLTMDYDLNGNRTVVTSSVRVMSSENSSNADTLHTSKRYFKYDAMNRQVLVDGVEGIDPDGVAGPDSHVVTYDKNGNRVSDTYTGNRVTINQIEQVHPNGEGEMIFTSIQYTYDVQAGVQITEDYRYDALNRLQSVERDGVQVDYRQYDGASRVVRSGTPDTLPQGYAEQINGDRTQAEAIGLEKRVNLYDAYGRLKYQNIFDGNAWNEIKQGVEYLRVDGVGNVLEYRLHTPQQSGGNSLKTYESKLAMYDGYVQEQLSVAGQGENGATYSAYDPNGFLRQIEDRVTPNNNRSFVTDAQGRVLLVKQGDHVRRQLIVNGESLGMFGVAPDEVTPLDPERQPLFKPVADFSFGYQPVSGNYPGAAPGVYTVRQGDSLQGIARSAYGDSRLWYRIAEANGLAGDQDLRVGQTLSIPAGVGTIHNDFQTFEPYDPSRVTGDRNPTLPFRRDEFRFLSNLIGVVVAIVVGYYTKNGAAAAAAGDAARQISSAMLNGRFDWKDFAHPDRSPSTKNPPGFTEVEYDYKSTAIAAAAGGVTQYSGLGAGAGAAAGASGATVGTAAQFAAQFAAQIPGRLLSGVVSQGLNMAMGRQRSFDWRGFVTGVMGIPTSAADLASVFGNALGNAVVDSMTTQNTAQESFRQGEIKDQNAAADRQWYAQSDAIQARRFSDKRDAQWVAQSDAIQERRMGEAAAPYREQQWIEQNDAIMRQRAAEALVGRNGADVQSDAYVAANGQGTVGKRTLVAPVRPAPASSTGPSLRPVRSGEEVRELNRFNELTREQLQRDYEQRLARLPGQSISAWDPKVDQARQAALARTRTQLGLAVGGPVFVGLAAGAKLAGASDDVVNNIGVAQTGLVLSLAGVPAPQSLVIRPYGQLGIPQGFTATEYAGYRDALRSVMEKEGLPAGETFIQGSRAAGTARLNSDIDVIHVVRDEVFDALVAQRLSQVQSEKIAGQIMKTANTQGRLTGRQISNTLERALWTDAYPSLPPNFSGTQFSIARESSSFMNGPLIPLNRGVDASGAIRPALPGSAPRF